MLPVDKEDAPRARSLVALGFPAVEPVLPQMLAWLKASDSPVALVLRDFFAALGLPAVPPVKKVLRGRHEYHRYAVVKFVLPHWPHDAIAALSNELQLVATAPDFYGTDIAALRLLVSQRLAERSWLEQWCRFKSKRLAELAGEAQEVRDLLAQWQSDAR